MIDPGQDHHRIPRMNKRQGLDFIMRGERLSAADAEATGLINKAVAAADLAETVASIAQDLANLAPGTMQIGLAAYNQQEEMDFDPALPFLRSKLDEVLQSRDAKEGITAFLDKREPIWD